MSGPLVPRAADGGRDPGAVAVTGACEETLVLSVGAERLMGVLSRPAGTPRAGLVIVVGGPQYRVGSHRQFVLLARHLAASGVAVLRFDVRGMGDSDGGFAGFEAQGDDIAAALAGLAAACPGLPRTFLWGLCDGASAILLHLGASGRSGVDGICLLNPWVRSAVGEARAQVKHYYGARLLSRDFWAKLAAGGVAVGPALREAMGKLRRARARHRADTASYQARMAAALAAYRRPVLVVLSGRDLTAREFCDHAGRDPAWRGLLAAPQVTRVDLEEADHTFSTAAWRDRVAAATLDWIGASERAA